MTYREFILCRHAADLYHKLQADYEKLLAEHNHTTPADIRQAKEDQEAMTLVWNHRAAKNETWR